MKKEAILPAMQTVPFLPEMPALSHSSEALVDALIRVTCNDPEFIITARPANCQLINGGICLGFNQIIGDGILRLAYVRKDPGSNQPWQAKIDFASGEVPGFGKIPGSSRWYAVQVERIVFTSSHQHVKSSKSS